MQLYQKYRPANLDQVKGQDRTIKELKNRCKNNNHPQVYYFIGKTGVGKTSIQRILTKNILCTNKDDEGNCCNECSVCKGIDSEKSFDNYMVFNASDVTTDVSRSISDWVQIKNLGMKKKKILVIDELQEFSKNKGALKNLLKTIETVNEDVIYIFGAMENLNIEAINNRCIPFNLKKIEDECMVQALIEIAEKEGYTIDTDEKANILLTISQFSNGSMRTALSLLERVIMSEIIDEKSLIEELKLYTNDTIISILNKLFIGDISVLDVDIDENILEKMKDILSIVFRKLLNAKLSQYESSLIKNLYKVEIPIIKLVMSKLTDLQKYTYISKAQFKFCIADIVYSVKPMMAPKVEEFNSIATPKNTPRNRPPRKRSV